LGLTIFEGIRDSLGPHLSAIWAYIVYQKQLKPYMEMKLSFFIKQFCEYRNVHYKTQKKEDADNKFKELKNKGKVLKRQGHPLFKDLEKACKKSDYPNTKHPTDVLMAMGYIVQESAEFIRLTTESIYFYL
jgi:hypothetical protein